MSADRPLRVHALIDGLGVGGAELLLAEFAAAAPQAGVSLSVGALGPVGGAPASERLRAQGVEPSSVPIHSLLSPRDMARVRAHVAAARADLLHTHLGNADLLGGLAARSLGLPAVSTVHADWWPDDARMRVKLGLMAQARRRCTRRVIAVSHSARKVLLEKGWDRPEHVVVVPNGIAAEPSPGAGREVRRQLGLGEGELVLTMLSSLRAGKGHEVGAGAVRLLRERGLPARLLVVGAGPLGDQVASLVAGLGQGGVLAGYRADVMAVLDASDALLQPSEYEAFPTSLLEAMAAGTPVVASAVGGVLEIVEDGRDGILVPAPPRPEAFADAVQELFEEPERPRSLADRGRERFQREFTARAWARRVRQVYDTALEG